MTILQSQHVTGQKAVPSAFEYGDNVSYIADFVIPAGLTIATTDILELAVLPAEFHIVSAQVMPTGAFGSGVTADIGIMSGDVGDKVSVRTSGAELFDDVVLTAMASLSKSDAIILAPSDQDRSIGVKFSAGVTGAGQILRLQVTLAQ